MVTTGWQHPKAIEYGEKLENEIDNQINSEAISLLEEYLTKDAENAQERGYDSKIQSYCFYYNTGIDNHNCHWADYYPSPEESAG